jgi:Flp pilus assembly protein CpaB
VRRSNRPLIFVGVLLAILAFFGVYLLSSGGVGTPTGSPTAHPTVAVVVAKQDIPLGRVVTEDMLGTADKDSTTVVADVVTVPRQIIGLRIRQTVLEGQVLQASMFSGEGVATNTEILRNLDSGFRAMAVQVDQVTGVGTLIQPGDHVDVIIALEDADGKFPVVGTSCDPGQPLLDPCVNNTSVKIIVQDAKVLATLLPPAPEGQSGTGSGATTLSGRSMMVLLQLRPQDVELVRFAQLDGNLSLVLRATADAGTAPTDTTGITLAELIRNHGVLPPNIVRP